jgi:hypothetical protein
MMDMYTQAMLKIVGAPQSINLNGKKVSPSLLVSPALGESALFWLASSISLKMHGEVLLDSVIVADRSKISGTRLVSVDKETTLSLNGYLKPGLASALMMISEAGSQILSPGRKHPNFDYAPMVLAFREAVLMHYNNGDQLKFDDFNISRVFYDTILQPTMAVSYTPPEISGSSIKR